MGCACVAQKKLVSKDIDLNTNINKINFNEIKDIKQINQKETKDIIDFSCKTKVSDDLSFSPKKKTKKKSSKNKSNKTLNYQINSDINSGPREQYISGPIITLLKKTVDNYNRKNGKNILM